MKNLKVFLIIRFVVGLTGELDLLLQFGAEFVDRNSRKMSYV